jgi:hypothetical protein
VWIWKISTRQIVAEFTGNDESTAWTLAEAHWADAGELNSAAGYFVSEWNVADRAFESYTELAE